MSVKPFFSTPIYQNKLLPQAKKNQAFVRELKAACLDVREYDTAGQIWSKQNYPHGFTSYSSWDNLHQRVSVFTDLKHELDQHARQFAKLMDWDLRQGTLQLTHLWVNIMDKGAFHDWHLHPLAVLSGTFYVDVSGSSSPLLFEDPRLSLKMAQPPLKARSRFAPHLEMKPNAGSVILFESWLKHKVPRQVIAKPRISLSFNYSWG